METAINIQNTEECIIEDVEEPPSSPETEIEEDNSSICVISTKVPVLLLVDVLKSAKQRKSSNDKETSVTFDTDGENSIVYYYKARKIVEREERTSISGLCAVCNYIFGDIEHHIKSQHRYGYVCGLCDHGTVHRAYSTMKKHLVQSHELSAVTKGLTNAIRILIVGLPMGSCVATNENDELCRICRRRYADLKEHTWLAHTVAYVCQRCHPTQVVFYTDQAASHHAITNHSSCNFKWFQMFLVIPSKTLEFLMPIEVIKSGNMVIPTNNKSCDVCNIQCHSLVQHKTDVHNYGFLCMMCIIGTIFLEERLLMSHIEKFHYENKARGQMTFLRVSTSCVPIQYTFVEANLSKFCGICNRLYGSDISLEEHEKLAHSVAFKCTLCPPEMRETFYLKQVAENHFLYNHHRNYQNSSIMELSTKLLPFLLNIQEQPRIIKQNTSTYCFVCDDDFRWLAQHMEEAHSHGYMCLKCNSSTIFLSESLVKMHVEFNHHGGETTEGEVAYVRVSTSCVPIHYTRTYSKRNGCRPCEICKRYYLDLTEHNKLAHSTAYQCLLCPSDSRELFYLKLVAFNHVYKCHNKEADGNSFNVISTEHLPFLVPGPKYCSILPKLKEKKPGFSSCSGKWAEDDEEWKPPEFKKKKSVEEEELERASNGGNLISFASKTEWCSICDLKFESLESHNIQTHKFGYMCMKCDSGTVFLTAPRLKSHFEASIRHKNEWKKDGSYVRVSTSCVPLHYTWVGHSKDPTCRVCQRRFKKMIEHRRLAHTTAFVCKLCPTQSRELFYLISVARNHIIKCHAMEPSKLMFYIISTKTLPFLTPVTEWPEEFSSNITTNCNICKLTKVERDHTLVYHKTAKQCSFCGSGYFYDDKIFCHPDAFYTEIDTKDLPVTKVCRMCDNMSVENWESHFEFYHGDECTADARHPSPPLQESKSTSVTLESSEAEADFYVDPSLIKVEYGNHEDGIDVLGDTEDQ